MADHPTNPEIRLMDGFWYADDPHPHWRWMREHAPVYWDEGGQVWGITRHADIQALSRDSSRFCNRFGMRPDSPALPSMINMDGDLHKRRRNLVNRGFTPRRVELSEPKVRAICNDLIDAVAERGECDFVRDLAAPLPMIMIGDMLGVAPEDRDMLLRWSDDLIGGTSATARPEAALAAARAFGEYAEYNRRVVALRRADPGDDLISVLVHAEIDGERLDDDALLQESLLILIGGDETTRHVISGGMEQLLRNPGEHRRLTSDPARIPNAVEEMLRWVTPIQNMARTVVGQVEVGGQKLRDGDKLLLLYPSGNRDAAVFDEPDRFDVERAPNDHLAFGGYGAHFCLGSSLARLELRVMFEQLTERLPDLELASDEPLPLRPSNFIVGIESMPVRFTPRAA
jgi:cytochrome P450 family 142 subfamily A polypeptide 1